MTFSLLEIFAQVLMFLRIGSIYFALPIFGDEPTSVQVRILASLATSICVYPAVQTTAGFAIPDSILAIALMVIKEITIGVVIGYTAKAAFEGIVMAASIVGFQMGFGTANLMVPDAGAPMGAFTALHRIIMILIFFSLNMHHTYIMAIGETFRVIPLAAGHFGKDFAPFFVDITAQIFATSIQLAAPVLVALMFSMAALGLIARTVPQMNIFIVSFPISFFVGLLIYMATFPFMPGWLLRHYSKSQEALFTAIHGFKGAL